MSVTARRTSISLTAALAVLGFLAAVLVVLAPAPARAAETGRVVGEITGRAGVDNIRMTWFTQDWNYLGKRSVDRGSYSLSLRPGTYWIQFTDRRPTYDVSKYAPTDLKVTVRAGRTLIKKVVMHRGAAITGTVRAGGKPAGGARIVAANTAGQSFDVTADAHGQFALGGLPAGSYSVFTYERTHQWVGRSAYVPGLEPGQASNIAVTLSKRAGKLLVLLSAGGEDVHKRVFVTAVSRATGQFWTQRSTSDGSVTFDGLYPGRYRLVMPGVGDYLARTGNVRRGRVRSGHLGIGRFDLTRHGASVAGIVVDHEDPSYPLEGAAVLLFDKAGDQLAATVTDDNGQFHFGGQLTTQSGMTVVAQPGPYSAFLGEEGTTHRCKYGRTVTDTFSVTTSRSTDIGAVELPHLSSSEQDASYCDPSDGS